MSAVGGFVGTTRTFDRFLFAVLAVSLLTMPVTYTGGAEMPHPHVFFQVWIDVAHGSFDHHHEHHPAMGMRHAGGMAAEAPASHVGDPDAPSLIDQTAPDTRQLALVASALPLLVLAWRRRRPRPADHAAPCGLAAIPEPPPPRLAAILI